MNFKVRWNGKGPYNVYQIQASSSGEPTPSKTYLLIWCFDFYSGAQFTWVPASECKLV